jgi:hypothetical protein
MKRFLSVSVVAVVVLVASAQAQQGKSTTRLQKQHKLDTESLGKHLKQTEQSVARVLGDTVVNMQITAVQNIRELQELFPEYPFDAVLTPLEERLRDENTDPVVRRLVALALDGLRSDAGDAIVKATAESSQDKGLRILCNALLIKGGLYEVAPAQATGSKSTTRLQKQHKLDTDFLRKHMKQTEQSLANVLKDTVVNMQITAVQNIRELEEIFPEYPFTALLKPLQEKLGDENTDPVVRTLVALALDGLHSDAGDAVIQATADSSPDKDLQTLCRALLIKSSLYR